MLRTVIVGAVSFVAGFGLAAVLTKSKYEEIMNEEIQAMREYVKKKTDDDSNSDKKAQVKKHEEDMKEFEKKITNYSGKKDEVEIVDGRKPYRIPEEDFVVDDEDFEKVTLEYYTETECLYENGELVPNDEEIVGKDNLNLLHGYSDDTIYVRNEKLGIDYEVIKIIGSGPER